MIGFTMDSVHRLWSDNHITELDYIEWSRFYRQNQQSQVAIPIPEHLKHIAQKVLLLNWSNVVKH